MIFLYCDVFLQNYFHLFIVLCMTVSRKAVTGITSVIYLHEAHLKNYLKNSQRRLRGRLFREKRSLARSFKNDSLVTEIKQKLICRVNVVGNWGNYVWEKVNKSEDCFLEKICGHSSFNTVSQPSLYCLLSSIFLMIWHISFCQQHMYRSERRETWKVRRENFFISSSFIAPP